eukprot:TRINITY_DN230_c0_g1_i1.p1 TRINITY_DN230_c0_g1~~TRINITY_DN230_c0_g1_i1.p1  ORF type:complete len:640 (+),score=130.61 TRINITY_DN230_c0_g1_i1:145-2064(+)
MASNQVIIVGGGLAGLSTAHTVLERGGSVVVIDKNSFLGGNSTKATSGINGALTKTQIGQSIGDSVQKFYEDTAHSARGAVRPELVKVLTYQSGSAVEWLQEAFGLDLSLVSRLGGHSFPRTHRGKERFPGMTITYALMEKLEDIAKAHPNRARIITKARVTKFVKEGDVVVGVEYEQGGQTKSESGPVVICTGGYASDFTDNSLLKKYRPDIYDLATTNGDHCTGDGIKLAIEIGANEVDMKNVQVHPTGLVDVNEPDAKVKFLAAEALRGVGGLLLDANGERFCDELGHRDYVTGMMWKNKGPFRLVLNGAGAKEIEWHCKHYVGRGLMRHFENGAALAKEMGIAPEKLEATFKTYNGIAESKKDPFGKKYFHNLPFSSSDNFHVAIVTPVLHYCMGGLEVNPESEVVGPKGVIPGLYAAGEVAGGVHGENRLGGNSLLDCVVFGRVSGASAARYLLQNATSSGSKAALRRASTVGSHLGGGISALVQVHPESKKVSFELSWAGDESSSSSTTHSTTTTSSSSSTSSSTASTANTTPTSLSAPAQPAAAQQQEEPKVDKSKTYTKEEVAKHNKESDCWVVVNDEVLDVTKFLPDHPGGKKPILLYAGKDATAEFNMLHKPDVVEKYAPDSIIGKLAK